MYSTCVSVHLSNCVDRTLEMCTPKLLWIPEQFVHMKIPKFMLAHRGKRDGHSAQTMFSGFFKHAFKRF
tara:strand:+ start:519 stop:725 length:207 start_codon:yes stop_codon:yes gene_type:complete